MPRKNKLKKAVIHPWDLSVKEAFALQLRLASMVVEKGELESLRRIAGCDLAFDKKNNLAIGALVVVSYPDLEIVERVTYTSPIVFPYVPGLLSFREGPVIMELFKKIREKPDLILFDGQGRAHPRGLGIASHLGLLLGIPSIGVAKSRLFGRAEKELSLEKGAMVDLLAPDGRVLGRMVRTRAMIKPVYVSVGHGVSLDEACRVVLSLAPRFRIPIPTREADRLAAYAKKKL